MTGVLLSLLYSAEAGAQSASSEAGAQSEIYSYGINHRIDSAKVVAVRARMDSIRSTRPVVALVLSGGGAKGVAHIGAIRRIEELGIPVDMVLGTSMGGLIGGMYSLGYGPDDMEKLVSEADWSYLITDKQPRKYISLNEMTYKGQHRYAYLSTTKRTITGSVRNTPISFPVLPASTCPSAPRMRSL